MLWSENGCILLVVYNYQGTYATWGLGEQPIEPLRLISVQMAITPFLSWPNQTQNRGMYRCSAGLEERSKTLHFLPTHRRTSYCGVVRWRLCHCQPGASKINRRITWDLIRTLRQNLLGRHIRQVHRKQTMVGQVDGVADNLPL